MSYTSISRSDTCSISGIQAAKSFVFLVLITSLSSFGDELTYSLSFSGLIPMTWSTSRLLRWFRYIGYSVICARLSFSRFVIHTSLSNEWNGGLRAQSIWTSFSLNLGCYLANRFQRDGSFMVKIEPLASIVTTRVIFLPSGKASRIARSSAKGVCTSLYSSLQQRHLKWNLSRRLSDTVAICLSLLCV